ncbi:diacylglycerol kinase catalytic domain-containing protein [Spiroplasma culicicola]|uniref:Inorganic polyphosphate/ATP-NAD kinase n=1 Tax=Spiroplasma culicicola AES-1 TaxID=1276246 RepID=W6A662_9MOLU|nr:NAD(+)/NADH kinase [Spiroplasma culicicola]AHI52608.1 inorganic polyphosphate/ATP-NAD kinase [Spiroplasma culicicola AES-1]
MFKFSLIKNDYQSSNGFSSELIENLIARGNILDEKDPDYVFVVGGDGTFLKAVQIYQNILDKVNFIPFKSGGIGFFTNKNRIDELETILEMIDTQSYFENSYELLEIKNGDNKFYITNEAKILNEKSAVYIKVYINDEYLETFHGTGLVVSTSSGSTGYMKSAGGSIILPKDAGIYQIQELFPISTNKYRTLNAPMILNSNYKLTLILEDTNELLICDTQERKIVDKTIEISLSKTKINVVSHIAPRDVFEIGVLRDIFIRDKEQVN